MTAPTLAPGSAPARTAVQVACAGCGTVAPASVAFPAACPAAVRGDDVDHVMARHIDLGAVRLVASDDPNPFIRYRQLFRAWHVALAAGWSDDQYVGVVRRLDNAVAVVDGHGFRVTPFGRSAPLSDELGFLAEGGAWVKDETGGVGGSHKARHLMGVMLELLVGEAVDPSLADRPLAIASCGNAALAAAIVARAAGRRLTVFVPPDAEAPVLDRLASLGAEIERVPRTAGEHGDPTVRHLRAAVGAGALPFTCQGPDNGLTIEGGETIAFEIVEALAAAGGTLDRLVVQVGGGALGSACVQGLAEARALGAITQLPRVDALQTAGAWPLRRAYERLASMLREAGLDPTGPLDPGTPAVAAVLAAAARRRSSCMWPWEVTPRSIAHGILDDETYDWLALVTGLLASGGRPVVVDDDELANANALTVRATGIDADETGTAGVAGVMHLRRTNEIEPRERVAVLLTGARRHDPSGASPRPHA